MTTKMVMAMLLAVALPAGATEPGDQQIDQRLPAPKKGRVSIDGGSGVLKVIGWDRDEVHVTGTLGGAAAGLELEHEEGCTKVGIDNQGHNPHGAIANLEIRVPAGSSVEVDAFAAAIDVSGVAGGVSAETVNGSIRVQAAGERIDASAVNGSVDVTARGGRVNAESVNGQVSFRGAAEDLDASTVNGALVVTVDRAVDVKLETVSGPLTFSGVVADTGSLRAESVSGSVELNFGAGQNAAVTMSTYSGSLQGGPAGRRKTRRWHEGERSAEITIGTGAAKVSVNTLSGSIIVRGKDMESKPQEEE